MLVFERSRLESLLMSLRPQATAESDPSRLAPHDALRRDALTQDAMPRRDALPRRETWQAVKRGLRGRCPACGQGRILHAYLKVNAACPSCGEELHHHRADDFPPYITIFVVGHIVGAAMFAVENFWPDVPTLVHMAVWPTLCIILSLWLLPIFKGGLIAYQWALRMHGFETAHQPAPAAGTEAQIGHRAAA